MSLARFWNAIRRSLPHRVTREKRDAFESTETVNPQLPTITDQDEKYRDFLAAVDRETNAELYEAGVAVQIGYLDVFYATKQHILRTKYGFNWQPPSQ